MGISNGFSNRPAFQPAAPRFAGKTGEGSQQTAAPKPAAQPAKKHGPIDTTREVFRCLREEWKDPEARNVLKGFSLKHLPEMAMTGLCALPGVGWLANMILIPVTMKMTKTGQESLQKTSEKLIEKKDDELHKGLKHLLRLDDKWNNYDPKQQFFGKKGEKKQTLPQYLITKYNKAVKGIFRKSDFLPKKLEIKDGSFINRHFTHWTNAGHRLRQTKFLGWIYDRMSGVSRNQVGKAFMPRFMRLFFIVPRLTLQGLFYLFRMKPKFPKP